MTLAAGIEGGPLADAVAAPEALLAAPDTRWIKDHRRTAVACAQVAGREVFVKRFKPYRWYRRVEAGFGGGFARRSWRAAERLAGRGFATAPALAIVETGSWGLPGDAYFVAEAVAGAVPGGRFWLESAPALSLAARRDLLRAVGRELRRLHDAGFYSRDANADNLLVRVTPGEMPRFFWIDLETIREVRSVSRRRRIKNLVQLGGVVGERASAGDRLRVVAAYLGEERAGLRDWLPELAAFERKKRAEYARRRGAE